MIETSGEFKCRALRSGGWIVEEDWWVQTEIDIECQIDGAAVRTGGKLWLLKGWTWDGASSVAIDTDTFLPGSSAHDAVYKMLRQGKLPPKYRLYADKLMRQLCEKYGMNFVRRWYTWFFVRLGASGSARRKRKEVDEIVKVVKAP